MIPLGPLCFWLTPCDEPPATSTGKALELFFFNSANISERCHVGIGSHIRRMLASASYSSDSLTEHKQRLANKGRGIEAAQRMTKLFSEMQLQNLIGQARRITLGASNAENESISHTNSDTHAMFSQHSADENPAAPASPFPSMRASRRRSIQPMRLAWYPIRPA